jgi:DNA mismatch repair protein MutS
MSLLGADSDTRRISKDAVQDLEIDVLVEAFAATPQGRRLVERALTQLPLDPDVTRYRQESFRFLHEHREVRERLRAVIPKIRELTVFSHSQGGTDSPFLSAVWRIGELDLYVECLDALHAAFDLASPPASAAGLRALRDAVAERRSGNAVEALRREIPPLKEGLRKRRSVTIGVNLDDRLRPVEAKLVSVHDRPFSETGLLTEFFRSFRSGEQKPVSAPLHRSPSGGNGQSAYTTKMPLSPLFQDLEGIMRTTSKRILSKIESFLSVETQVIQSLPDELEFFIGAADLADRLHAAGLPTCTPTLDATTSHTLSARAVYNLPLALRRLNEGSPDGEPVVTNDIAMGPNKRGAIVTGPNRGGKTTYLQALGQLQVLTQAGLFAPAKEATVSPVDYVATHFPQREHSASELGRFGEEVARLSEIFDELSSDSFVILNESFASTNPSEAIAFGSEVLKALADAGTRALVATHLVDMARTAESMGHYSALTAQVETTEHGAVRTFRIVPGVPESSSYAYDLVKQAGMTYEQLSERLQRRGILPKETDS